MRLSDPEKKINFLWQQNIFVLRLENSKMSDSHRWWSIGTRCEVSLSFLLYPLLMAQSTFLFFTPPSPLKLGQLTIFWYQNTAWVCKRKEVTWSWNFTLEWSRSDNLSVNHVAKPSRKEPCPSEDTAKFHGEQGVDLGRDEELGPLMK